MLSVCVCVSVQVSRCTTTMFGFASSTLWWKHSSGLLDLNGDQSGSCWRQCWLDGAQLTTCRGCVHRGDFLGVTLHMLGEMVAAHERFLAFGADKLLFAGVRSLVAG